MMRFDRLKNKFFAAAFLCAIIVLSLFFSANCDMVLGSPQKTVYVVICVDTEPYSGKFLGDNTLHPIMNVSDFFPYSPAHASPSEFTKVFESSFRNSFNDSLGGTFKITWFAVMDYLCSQSIFVNATGPAGVSGYTAMLDLLTKYWGTQIQSYGDSIEYHHHFEVYNGTWQRHDNGPDKGYPDYEMNALDHMIIDDNFYPSVFRSGWNIMSTPLSNWIEQWIPFDYCPGNGGHTPIHAYPGMNHWQIQTPINPDLGQVQDAFVQARNYGSSIYSFYMHSFGEMAGNITALQSYLTTCAKDQVNYPGVNFKYVTASQAMQLALGAKNFSPPTFAVSRNGSTYVISSNTTLWGNSPYVAIKYLNGTYTHINATPVATNTWKVIPANSSSIVEIGIAGSSLDGNPNVLVFSPLDPPQGSIPMAPTPPSSSSPEVQVPVHGITASSYYNSSYNPGKAIDGIETPSNYWGTDSSALLPQWLTLDLWNQTIINQVTTHFYDFNTRTYTYYVEASTDGSSWFTVVSAKSGSGLVTDTFPQVTARFVRLTVTGNSANTAAHVEEIEVNQPTLASNSTPTPTPTPSPTPTPTPTPTITPTPTTTPTPTPNPTPTSTPTSSPTTTPNPTPTATPTPTSTSTPFPEPTPTPSPASTPTNNPPSPTPSFTPTPISTPTSTPSKTSENKPQTNSDSIINYYTIGAIVAILAVGMTITVIKRNFPRSKERMKVRI